ncbi:slipin family protein, partial [Streptomyces sp. NPDC052115]
LLQTVVAVAAEKNSTLVLPFPVELLRFLERAQQALPQPPDGGAPGLAKLPDSGAANAEVGENNARGGSRTGQD